MAPIARSPAPSRVIVAGSGIFFAEDVNDALPETGNPLPVASGWNVVPNFMSYVRPEIESVNESELKNTFASPGPRVLTLNRPLPVPSGAARVPPKADNSVVDGEQTGHKSPTDVPRRFSQFKPPATLAMLLKFHTLACNRFSEPTGFE